MKVAVLLGILFACGIVFFVFVLLLDSLLVWLGVDMNSVVKSYQRPSLQSLPASAGLVVGRGKLRSRSHQKKIKRMFVKIRGKRKGK